MPIPAPPNNQPGAALWDQATQGSDRPPVPGQLIVIVGGPEGVIYAPVGYLCRDETGKVWVKTTAYDVNTGWTQLTVP